MVIITCQPENIHRSLERKLKMEMQLLWNTKIMLMKNQVESNIWHVYSKGEIKDGIKVGEWEFYNGDYQNGEIKIILEGSGTYENGVLLNFKLDEEYKKDSGLYCDYDFYPNGKVKRTYNINDGIIEEEFYGENGIDYSSKETNKETNEVRYEVNQKIVGNILTIELNQLKNKEYVKSKIVYEFASPEEIVFEKSEEGDRLTVKNASIKYYRNENLIEELNVKNGKIQENTIIMMI